MERTVPCTGFLRRVVYRHASNSSWIWEKITSLWPLPTSLRWHPALPSYTFLSLPRSHLCKFHFFPTLFAIHAGFPSLFQDLPWARRVSHPFFFFLTLFPLPIPSPHPRGCRLCVLLFRALFEEVLTLLFLRVCAWKDGSDEPDPGLGLWLSWQT